MVETSWTQTYPATCECVPLIRREVLAELAATGCAGAPLGDIRLVVTEACSNAAVHAYPGREGTVTVRLSVEAECVELEVSDEGRGIVPWDETRQHGLGMPMMAGLAQRLSVRSTIGEGTCVTAGFDLLEDEAA